MRPRRAQTRARMRSAREASFAWPVLACLVVLGHIVWFVALWALFVVDGDSADLRYEYSAFKDMVLGPTGIPIPTTLGLSLLACTLLLGAGAWRARKHIDRKTLAGLAMALIAIASLQWLTSRLAAAARTRDADELASVSELRARFEVAGPAHEEHATRVFEILRSARDPGSLDYVDVVFGSDWEWFSAQYRKIQALSPTPVFAPRIRSTDDGRILYYIHARNGIAEATLQQGIARCPSTPEFAADEFPRLDEHRPSTPYFVPLRGNWYAFQCRGPLP